MSRFMWLKLLIPIQLLSALIQGATGIIFIVGKGNEVLGDVHLVNGILLLCLVLVHIALNLPWLRMAYFKAKESPREIGIKAA